MSTKELNPIVDEFSGKLGELSIEDLMDLTDIVNAEKQRRRVDTIKETLARMKLMNISPEDLLEEAGSGGRQGVKATQSQGQAGEKQKVPPKYRNPNDASKVWTGRGNPPGWVRDLDNQGIARDTYLINSQPEGEEAASGGESGQND